MDLFAAATALVVGQRDRWSWWSAALGGCRVRQWPRGGGGWVAAGCSGVAGYWLGMLFGGVGSWLEQVFRRAL